MEALPSPTADRVQAAEQAAFEQGYADGRRDGLAAATAGSEERLARLAEAIEEVRSLRAAVLHRAEREAARLALAIAEQVLRRTVAGDPGELVLLARRVIDRLDGASATIHLHPEDFGAVAAAVTPTLTSGVELAADAGVPPGGCLIRSSFGTIDLGIDAQVREIARTFFDDERDEAAHEPGTSR